MCIMVFLALVPLSVQTTPSSACLHRAMIARESIRTGELFIVRTFEARGHAVHMTETAMFNEQRYRIDVHEHSEYAKLFDLSNSRRPDHLAVLIYDGAQVLQRLEGLSGATYSIHPLEETLLGTYNARVLGLPGLPGTTTDLRKLFRLDCELVSFVQEGDVHRVRVRERLPGIESTVSIEIDASRGWSATAFQIDRRYLVDGSHYLVVGMVDVAPHGNVWFPTWYQIEQFQVGGEGPVSDWREEGSIHLVSLNQVIDDSEFDWPGTGIRPGTQILSYATGVPHAVWNGRAAVSLAEYNRTARMRP